MAQGNDNYGMDNNVKRVILGNIDRELGNETNRSIRKIMEVIERYTDYESLYSDRKSIVIDTVLNQINRLVRVTKHKQTLVFRDKEL